jgi:hypothetical protein
MTTPHADKGDHPLRRVRWQRSSSRRDIANMGRSFVDDSCMTAMGKNRGQRSGSIVCSPCLNPPPRETKAPRETVFVAFLRLHARPVQPVIRACRGALCSVGSGIVHHMAWPHSAKTSQSIARCHGCDQGSKASLRSHSSLLHTSNTRVSHLHRRLLNFGRTRFRVTFWWRHNPGRPTNWSYCAMRAALCQSQHSLCVGHVERHREARKFAADATETWNARCTLASDPAWSALAAFCDMQDA